MAQVGLFYGSDEGNTEVIAQRIQARFGADVVATHDIADVTQLEFAEYDKIILGIPTWDFGQIQSDWEEFWDDLEEIDFTDKTIALFGLGDQFGYGDYFLDAMGMLHDLILARGATFVGYWPVEGYEFEASKAVTADGRLFVGLGLDQDQQEELTAQRLNTWCAQVANDFELGSVVAALED